MGERPLQGKTALITGAAKRLGRAIALALADDGVNVVVHYRHSAEEEAADLSDPDACDALLDRARGAVGGVDILVNNASAFDPSTREGVTWEQLTADLRLNASAPLAVSRRFAEGPARERSSTCSTPGSAGMTGRTSAAC
jgi:NAD(P)-dependent dehydrogenase (short-subunit alcohol dehydrogenase family)